MVDDPYREPPELPTPSSMSNRSRPIQTALATIAIVVLLGAFLLPMSRVSRPAGRRTQCLNNFRNISLALLQYHDDYDVFPPACTVDADGNRLHSWRTLILPYLDQNALYDSIDLSKAWDDPVNAAATEFPVAVFMCPSADLPRGHTTYLANSSNDGVLRPGRSRQLSEITDWTPRTLMVVEVSPANAVHWMAPIDDVGRLFVHLSPDSDVAHAGMTINAMADGSVHSVPLDLSEEERRALMTSTGGETISW